MKIFCIANNYASHNKEAESALYRRKEPVFFMKPDSALLAGGTPFFLPDQLGETCVGIHLVVHICRLGKTIPERFAHRYWDMMTVGLDFTAATLLTEAQSQGLPWTMAKALDGSAVIGQWVERPQLPEDIPFCLKVNGQPRQQGHSSEMLHSIDKMVSRLSETFTLKQGDLLFTGTLAGERPIQIGDSLEGTLADKTVLTCRCK